MVTFLMSALLGFLEADSIIPMVVTRSAMALIAVWFGCRIFKTQKRESLPAGSSQETHPLI